MWQASGTIKPKHKRPAHPNQLAGSILAPQWGVPLDSKQAAQLKACDANLRRERVRQSMTQERLAEIVALHPRTVQKIERGRTNILITTAIRLQRALPCRWENLFGKP